MSQPDAALATLDSTTLLLTPNVRLSRELLNRHARLQRAQGINAWLKPAILPFSVWLQQLYQHQQAVTSDRRWHATLLDEWAQRLLWRQAVETALPTEGLFRVADLAAQASEAWNLLQLWQVPQAAVANELAVDDSFGWLQQWMDHFRNRCAEQGWISPAELPALISTAIAAGTLTLPKTVLLYAFDELPPAWQALLDQARSAGATILHLEPDPRPSQPQRLPCEQERDELRAIAAWCRQLLTTHGDELKIGVVVPELPRLRGQLIHELKAQLEPHSLLPATAPYTPPFNLSAPIAMPTVPIIADALTLLALASGAPLTATTLRQILLSPFVAAGGRHAQLEVALQQERHHNWSPQTLQSTLRRLDSANTPFITALIDLLEQAQQCSSSLLPSKWQQRFSASLLALGWPGERTLNSEELQAVESWREALQHFAMLDPYSATLDAMEALQLLTELLSLSSFQLKSTDSPIQILGLLEASGLQFDQLWIMGLDRSSWPAIPAPNALLPIGWQRRLGLPRATAEREIEFATRITRRLISAADQVVLSHACRKAEEPLDPSPLIEAWPATTVAALRLDSSSSIDQLRLQPLATRPCDDNQGAVLETAVDTPIRGGTQLIKDQAACPFRAYANHRLRLLPVQPPQLGFDARERGTFSHLLMERFWRQVGSLERLKSADPASCEAWCQQAVDEVMRQHCDSGSTARGRRLWQIERERLLRLLRAAIVLDLQRSDFTVSVEQAALLSIGPLLLRTRADRIDQLEDGSLLLIDYKGSERKAAEWLGERPDEPQLPLYLLQQASHQPMAAIAFFILNTEHAELIGLGNSSDLAPGIKLPYSDEESTDPWTQQISLWRQHLTWLAEEFAAGVATVTPKSLQTSCGYCPHRSLCRIDDHE